MTDADLTTAVLNLTGKVGEQTATLLGVQRDMTQMRIDNAADHNGVLASIDELAKEHRETRETVVAQGEENKATRTLAQTANDIAYKAFYLTSAYAAAVTGLRLFG